ncbi:MAG: hypothetical protein ACR2F0_01220 [Chthoniobacterales bacterium]
MLSRKLIELQIAMTPHWQEAKAAFEEMRDSFLREIRGESGDDDNG